MNFNSCYNYFLQALQPSNALQISVHIMGNLANTVSEEASGIKESFLLQHLYLEGCAHCLCETFISHLCQLPYCKNTTKFHQMDIYDTGEPHTYLCSGVMWQALQLIVLPFRFPCILPPTVTFFTLHSFTAFQNSAPSLFEMWLSHSLFTLEILPL